MAVLSVIAALFIALLLQIQYHFEPFVLFLCAMMFSAWFGGVKPGLLALALSMLAFHYYFLVPINPLGVEMEIPRLLVAALTSLFVVVLSAAQSGAMAALRESEQRYLSLFENMAEGVAYLRIVFENGEPQDAIYLEVNPAWQSLTGLRDVVGRRVSQFVPNVHEVIPEFFERSGRVAVTGRPERFETYSTSLKKWLSIAAYRPRKGHVIAVLDDITERKHTEHHRRLVIDSIPTMAWSVRPDGVVDFLNQPWLDYTGLSLEQYLKEPTGPIHPDDIPRVLEKWRAGIAIGTPYEDEMRLRRADGEYRWFLVRTVPLSDGQGNIVKWYGTSTDIEDRKRAEDGLRQSEFDLAEAQRVARLGSWTFDVATQTVRWSDETYRIFDVEKTTSGNAYETFLSHVHPDDRNRVWEANAKARSSGESFEVEYRINTRGGHLKHIRELGHARKHSSGAVLDLFGTAQDITERKQAENALRDSAVQLQALSRRLVELQESERKELARELHDRVGQNLTALKINIDILQSVLASQGKEEVVARIADSATLLESTMDTIENVMSELRPPMLDDHGLAAALDWYARNFSRRTGISVAVRAGEPAVRSTPQVEITLFRIAQEALNNVAKHAAAQHIEIALDQANGECLMSVEDDGIGFNCLNDASGKPKPGLGIVTMRERSQAVGGRLEVKALPGGGTQLAVRVQC